MKRPDDIVGARTSTAYRTYTLFLHSAPHILLLPCTTGYYTTTESDLLPTLRRFGERHIMFPTQTSSLA